MGGQDGAYLSRLLLDKGYTVFGTSRDAVTVSFANLSRLGIRSKVITASMDVTDFSNVVQTIGKFRPDEIYNLAGQSSVGLSFEKPIETMESIANGTLNLLEAIRSHEKSVRFFSAGSSECFGDAGSIPANEETPFRPRSPYAIAKTAAHHLVENYREAYSIYACTGIQFNHESPLRSERFVTQKIVRTAARIASGSDEKLEIGNINIQRDWGWAPEYVEAMWLMLQLNSPQDFVVATGRSVSLETFIEQTFLYFGLNYKDYLLINSSLFRPADILVGRANPSKASQILNWQAKVDIEAVIENMCFEARNSMQI